LIIGLDVADAAVHESGTVVAPPALTSPALLSQRERREKRQESLLSVVPLSPSGREGPGE
jgi:hypothetical protein